MKDKGNTIDVELNIVPQKMEVKDEVYLSMSLAQDKDNDESGRALDFVSLSIDGVDIEIPDFIEIEKDGVIEKIDANKDQIKLGKLLEKQAYKVIATIEKPKNVFFASKDLLTISGAGRFLLLSVVLILLMGGFDLLALGLAFSIWLLGLVVFEPCTSALFGISNKSISTKEPFLSLGFKKHFISSLNSSNNFFIFFLSSVGDSILFINLLCSR
jgi:hypothetical protein